jgi:mono/diheme cytochrome c family protein
MTVKLRTIGIIALLVLVLGAAGAALTVQLGLYNIAATVQHTRLVYRLMDYTMYRSVKARSERAAVPDLDEPRRVRAGAVHYRAHCLQCHGAPGVSPDDLAFGMTPAPVNLVSTARIWNPEEIFWVVKHGIKMTGMPAWKYRLTDDEIWSIVAFAKAMVALGPRDYAAMAATLPEHRHAGRKDNRAARSPAPGSGTLDESFGGDVKAGRRATEQYLCATCHTIPGIVGASRQVGPPLNGVGRRKFIGGILSNTPENMVRWLQDPQQFDPLSAMPALGLTEKDARDIAAFLYTLDDVR